MRFVAAVCLALVATFGAPSFVFAKSAHVHKVLFVCTGNFYRSRFAEALFNEKHPKQWTAFSRGLDTSKPRNTPVSPLVATELERRHIATPTTTPQQLTQADLDAADLIVLLDGEEHAPMLKAQFPKLALDKVKSWSVADVPKLAAPKAFTAIEHDTDALIGELGKVEP